MDKGICNNLNYVQWCKCMWQSHVTSRTQAHVWQGWQTETSTNGYFSDLLTGGLPAGHWLGDTNKVTGNLIWWLLISPCESSVGVGPVLAGRFPCADRCSHDRQRPRLLDTSRSRAKSSQLHLPPPPHRQPSPGWKAHLEQGCASPRCPGEWTLLLGDRPFSWGMDTSPGGWTLLLEDGPFSKLLLPVSPLAGTKSSHPGTLLSSTPSHTAPAGSLSLFITISTQEQGIIPQHYLSKTAWCTYLKACIPASKTSLTSFSSFKPWNKLKLTWFCRVLYWSFTTWYYLIVV